MAVDEKYPLALPQGTILAGQYVIEQALGQGGFGITYKATDHKTGQSVAVKEFFPDSMASRTTQTTVTAFPGERGESFVYGKGCFLQEAETLAEFIGNENIVRVYSYFEENGTAYFVMEFIEGKSFDQYIKEQGGKVTYEEAEKILLPVIDALALVHAKGIVHRDVTPDNIYITKDGKVKLLDFGAARYSLGDKSRSLDIVLKHGFAPKEQYTRHGRQGPYTDVYTVGASFYFAITGRRPQDSIDRMDEDELITPSSLGVKISPDKEDAILKAMSVQPSNRYQTMVEFHRALMSAEETGTQQLTPPQTAQEAMPVQEAAPQQVQQRVFTAPQPIHIPQQDDAVARLRKLHEEVSAAADAAANEEARKLAEAKLMPQQAVTVKAVGIIAILGALAGVVMQLVVAFIEMVLAYQPIYHNVMLSIFILGALLMLAGINVTLVCRGKLNAAHKVRKQIHKIAGIALCESVVVSISGYLGWSIGGAVCYRASVKDFLFGYYNYYTEGSRYYGHIVEMASAYIGIIALIIAGISLIVMIASWKK